MSCRTATDPADEWFAGGACGEGSLYAAFFQFLVNVSPSILV